MQIASLQNLIVNNVNITNADGYVDVAVTFAFIQAFASLDEFIN